MQKERTDRDIIDALVRVFTLAVIEAHVYNMEREARLGKTEVEKPAAHEGTEGPTQS